MLFFVTIKLVLCFVVQTLHIDCFVVQTLHIDCFVVQTLHIDCFVVQTLHIDYAEPDSAEKKHKCMPRHTQHYVCFQPRANHKSSGNVSVGKIEHQYSVTSNATK